MAWADPETDSDDVVHVAWPELLRDAPEQMVELSAVKLTEPAVSAVVPAFCDASFSISSLMPSFSATADNGSIISAMRGNSDSGSATRVNVKMRSCVQSNAWQARIPRRRSAVRSSNSAFSRASRFSFAAGSSGLERSGGDEAIADKCGVGGRLIHEMNITRIKLACQ